MLGSKIPLRPENCQKTRRIPAGRCALRWARFSRIIPFRYFFGTFTMSHSIFIIKFGFLNPVDIPSNHRFMTDLALVIVDKIIFIPKNSPIRREYSSTSGCDCACTLVIHNNDAIRGDIAFRHLERRWDRAIGKQSFSTAQRYRIYHQPERIDQIMLHERLKESTTSPNVQIRSWLLLDFGDFFCNISV